MLNWLRNIFAIPKRLTARSSRQPGIFVAGRDMTEYDRIRELVHWADDQIEVPDLNEIVLDLSRVTHMDSSFLAGVLLVCRRAHARDLPVKIKNMPSDFQTLVDLYRIRHGLVEAGVIFIDDPDSVSDATGSKAPTSSDDPPSADSKSTTASGLAHAI